MIEYKTMTTKTDKKPFFKNSLSIDLALQGGGAHGAFTWGVLDRLLEETHLKIEGISGTSAGAMNAAVLMNGYAKDGAEGARASLEDFWQCISKAAMFGPFRRSPFDILAGHWTLDYSPAFIAFDIATRLFSPYDLNPFDLNPLRQFLHDNIDFKLLGQSPIKLFVTATNVHTGRGRVFHNKEISSEVLLASACLPTMFQAVEIDGEFYWDGGYAGNPTITPLIQECDSSDTILVQINPVVRQETPKTAGAILNRLNEISFNAPLLKELRMIAVLQNALTQVDKIDEANRWAGMRIHRIASDAMNALGHSSKLNAEWGFLKKLRDEGRRVTEEFLSVNGKDIGVRSSLNLSALL